MTASEPDVAGRRGTAARLLPWLLIAAVPIVIGVVLLAGLDRDPTTGLSGSNAAFSDEGYRVLSARNLVQLGHLDVDEWALHILEFPFTVIEAAVFAVLGVGLVQARLISVAATVGVGLVIGFGLRRPLGTVGAVFAGATAMGSSLAMFYGRLAMLEPMVAFALAVAAVLLLRSGPDRPRRWGIATGLALAFALGVKLNAIGVITGLLGGAAVLGIHRRWLWTVVVTATATMVVVAIGWLVLFVLPNPQRLADAFDIYPTGSIPGSIVDVLANAIGYFRHDDGAGRLAAPVWLGAVIGTSIWGILAWLDRPSVLRSTAWPVFVLGLGWVLVGMVPVLVIGYQPNRYVVPVLPGLSLIIGSAVSIGLERWRGSAASRRDPWLTPVALVVLLVAIVGPGIGAAIDRTSRATHNALDGIAAVSGILGPDDQVEGNYAPLFAMTTPATIHPVIGSHWLNSGDAYDNGVRWVLASFDSVPAWAAAHPEAWAARDPRWCTFWGRTLTPTCLYRVP